MNQKRDTLSTPSRKPAVKIIWALAVLLLLPATYQLVFLFYSSYYENISFHPTGDVIILNDLFTRMFLIKTDTGYIAVDTGFHEEIIRKGLAYNDIRPEDVHTVLITHSDLDHQHAAEVFSHAQFYFPQREIHMIENKTPRLRFIPFLRNHVSIQEYRAIDDTDSLQIDNSKVKCIALPGHTFGSMGYVINGKHLFSGDAFRIKNGVLAAPHFKFLVMDPDEMKRSIEKVRALKGIEYIFTSNSGFIAGFSPAAAK